ncbi:MAG: glycosyltransferase family 39 protein [Bdellovibrionales bacterium]|nr:glycosyltransferase family 39 protein [Bdellovibrionales bacterium]
MSSEKALSIWLIALLGGVLLVRNYFGFSLSSSLWLDEAITAWIINADLQEVFRRTLNFQGHSPLYFTLMWLYRAGGFLHEWQLRLPSLLLSIATLVSLAAITRAYFSDRSSLVVVLFALSFTPWIRDAVNARPYALALAGVHLSTLLFLSLIKDFRLWKAALYLCTLVITCYAHYLSALVVTVHLFFFLLLPRSEKGISLRGVILAWTVSAVALIPGMIHFQEILERSALYSYPVPLSLKSTLINFFPLEFLVPFIFAMVVARIFFPYRLALKLDQKILAALLWFLFPPLVFLALSCIRGENLFFSRYFEWHFGGLALLATGIFLSIDSLRAKKCVVLVFVVMQLLAPRTWQLEQWREVAEVIRSAPEPVVVYTGLIELENATFRQNPKNRDYLLAPFQYYPVPNEMELTSSSFETLFSDRLEPLSSSVLVVTPKIVQFSDPARKGGVRGFVTQELKKRGFKEETLVDSQVVLQHYEKSDLHLPNNRTITP